MKKKFEKFEKKLYIKIYKKKFEKKLYIKIYKKNLKKKFEKISYKKLLNNSIFFYKWNRNKYFFKSDSHVLKKKINNFFSKSLLFNNSILNPLKLENNIESLRKQQKTKSQKNTNISPTRTSS